MSTASAQTAFSTAPTPQDPYKYQVGFGNRFASEAIPGTLPVAQNTPQKVKNDLYTEAITATPFVGPRAQAQSAWLYRIRPTVANKGIAPHPGNKFIESDFTPHNPTVSPELRHMWSPFTLPAASERVTFLDGLRTLCGGGSAVEGEGVAVHIYAANAGMERTAFCNNDGDMLVQPQLGRLDVQTEFGRMMVKPGELFVVQKGIRFRIGLPDGPSRGYVTEIFGSHFELPELGPLGGHGLANPRDFEYPVASFDIDAAAWQVVYKHSGKFSAISQDHTPFDVVAWHGNYVPFKYDVDKFISVGSVTREHLDPSVYTVLTAKSRVPNVSLVDIAAFLERWDVTENTFRPPFFHRNVAAELMAPVRGAFGGQTLDLAAGGFQFQASHVPHGPTWEVFKDATEAKLAPTKIINDSMIMLIESTKALSVTDWALNKNPDLKETTSIPWGTLEPQFFKHLDKIDAELEAAGLPKLVRKQ